jgi:hypothetical protein
MGTADWNLPRDRGPDLDGGWAEDPVRSRVSYDYSITPRHDGLVAHTPDCPEVAEARRDGSPIFTLMDCATPIIPEDVGVILHSCLATK